MMIHRREVDMISKLSKQLSLTLSHTQSDTHNVNE